MNLFWTGLITGLLSGGGLVGLFAVFLVSKLFETHRLALAQALASRRVLESRDDPARPRSTPPTPKTEYELAMQRIEDLRRQEAKMFGDK